MRRIIALFALALGSLVPASAQSIAAAELVEDRDAAATSPAPPRRRAPLSFELRAGPWLGLDRPLRGCMIAAALGFEAGTLEPSLRAHLAYDASLGPLIVGADIGLGFGGELRFLVGGELPLGQASLRAGASRLALDYLPWPNRFAVAAVLAELGVARRARPRAQLEVEFSWSAYGLDTTMEDSSDTELSSSIAGIAGFSAGFRAFLGLRLLWAPAP